MSGNTTLAVGADPDRDPDPGILTEFSSLWDKGHCKSVVGSAALAEVCGCRVLLVVCITRCSLIGH